MPWKKGQSGNPSGKRKHLRPALKKTITELARDASPEAIKTLITVMTSEKSTMTARAIAADRILDRAYGKAPQAVAVVGTSTCLKRAADMTDDELAAIAAGLIGGKDDEPLLIEGEVISRDQD